VTKEKEKNQKEKEKEKEYGILTHWQYTSVSVSSATQM